MHGLSRRTDLVLQLLGMNLEPVKVEQHLLQHLFLRPLQHPLQHLHQQMAQHPWENAGALMSCSKVVTSSLQPRLEGPICAKKAAMRTWSALTGLSTKEDSQQRV